LRWLELHSEALDKLRELVRADGASEVLRVAREALGAAADRQIAPSWWSRIFCGGGFEARRSAAAARGAAEERRNAALRKAARPLTDIELRLLGRSA